MLFGVFIQDVGFCSCLLERETSQLKHHLTSDVWKNAHRWAKSKKLCLDVIIPVVFCQASSSGSSQITQNPHPVPPKTDRVNLPELYVLSDLCLEHFHSLNKADGS